MSLKISLGVLCILAASSRAEGRFVVHPTDGGLAVSSNPCGQATRDYLEKVVSDKPMLELGKNDAMTLTRTGFAPAPASDTFPGSPVIGLWTFGTMRWAVSVRPFSERSKQAVVEIQLSRRVDEKVCYEKWQGTAEQ